MQSCAGVTQKLCNFQVATCSRQHQYRPALNGALTEARTCVQQQPNDSDMTFRCRDLDWRALQLSAFTVEIGTCSIR